MKKEFISASSTGAKAPIFINGPVVATMDFVTITGSKEKLVEEWEVSGGVTSPGVKTTTIWEIGAGVSEDTTLTLGNMAGVSSTQITLLDTDTPLQIADKIRAATMEGFTISGEGTTVIIEYNQVGNDVGSIVFDSFDPVVDISNWSMTPVLGSYEGGGKKEWAVFSPQPIGDNGAGTITLDFNGNVQIVNVIENEDPMDMFAKLIAACPSTHELILGGGALIVQNKSIGAHVVPMTMTADTETGWAFMKGMEELGADAVGGSGEGGIKNGDIKISVGGESLSVRVLANSTLEDILDTIKFALSYKIDKYKTSITSDTIEIEALDYGEQPDITINLGNTGINKKSSTNTKGTVATYGSSTANGTLEGTIDTGKAVEEGNAKWFTLSAADPYDLRFPLTALRVNVATAHASGYARVITQRQ